MYQIKQINLIERLCFCILTLRRRVPQIKLLQGFLKQIAGGLVFFIILNILTSCSSLREREESKMFFPEKTIGKWEGKAQIKDKVKSTVERVQIVFIGEKTGNVRMDVSTLMGISVATVVISNQEVRYMLPQQKKYYNSLWSDQAFAPLFKVNIHPQYLISIAFDIPLNEEGWQCQMDNGLLASCQNKEKRMSLTWKDRVGEQKRVFINSEDYEIQILFKSFTTKVQIDEKLFSLPVPIGYKQYKL